MKLKFKPKYLLLTILIFLVEVLIATVLKNNFFHQSLSRRCNRSDIALHTFVKSFFTVNDTTLILGIFAFSCVVEFAQYFNIAEKLGFQPGSLMYIVIGNSFSWVDIACYAAGCLLLYLLVKLKK